LSQSLVHGSVPSPSVQTGETLVPSIRDVLISFESVPASASAAADTSVGDCSPYVRSLADHLQPGVDVKDALNKAGRQIFPEAQVVSTLNRPLIFPRRDALRTLPTGETIPKTVN